MELLFITDLLCTVYVRTWNLLHVLCGRSPTANSNQTASSSCLVMPLFCSPRSASSNEKPHSKKSFQVIQNRYTGRIEKTRIPYKRSKQGEWYLCL